MTPEGPSWYVIFSREAELPEGMTNLWVEAWLTGPEAKVNAWSVHLTFLGGSALDRKNIPCRAQFLSQEAPIEAFAAGDTVPLKRGLSRIGSMHRVFEAQKEQS